MVVPLMKPPQGRIQIGWRVRTIEGREGEVVAERLVQSNGAWYYTITFGDGAREERPDYELRRMSSDAGAASGRRSTPASPGRNDDPGQP